MIENFEQCKHCENYKKIKDILIRFEKRISYIKPPPGKIPDIQDIDMHGEIIAKKGSLGGDHIIFVDFNKRFDLDARIQKIEKLWNKDIKGFSTKEINTNRFIQKKFREKEQKIKKILLNKKRAGVLLADVKGHDESAALLVGMFHQTFLYGILCELEKYGEVTKNLFETINTRFYHSSARDDFVTTIYGEINQNGEFNFLTAGHTYPLIFSNKENRLVEISKKSLSTCPAIGIMPSAIDIDVKKTKSFLGHKPICKIIKTNLLEKGDFLILFTDGLIDHTKGNSKFLPNQLEKILQKHKKKKAKRICQIIKEEIYFFNSQLDDDISYVIIKKDE